VKVCLDANVFISYLLQSSASNPPTDILSAAFAGAFEIVLDEMTILETRRSIASKPYLAHRIRSSSVDALMDQIERMATIVGGLTGPFPSITRDPGDDYLITHAVLHAIDYLVTGDKDLLVLEEVAGVRIVSPAEFVAILDTGTGS